MAEQRTVRSRSDRLGACGWLWMGFGFVNLFAGWDHAIVAFCTGWATLLVAHIVAAIESDKTASEEGR